MSEHKRKPNCPKCKKGYMESTNPFIDEYTCSKCGYQVKWYDPIQIAIGGY